MKAKDPDLNQPVCHMLDLKVETVIEQAKAVFEQSRPLFGSVRRGRPAKVKSSG
jgi:hypothetical protein